MGNKFVVMVWARSSWFAGDKYQYCEFWRGESFFRALWKMFKAKDLGYRCVKLEWRP